MDLNEIWNNIFSHYMEHDQKYEITPWLNPKKEDDYHNSTDSTGKHYTSSFQVRLEFFIKLFDFSGPEKEMSAINAGHRRGEDRSMLTSDYFIKKLSEVSGYNISSCFEEWGFPVSQDIKRLAFENGYSNNTRIQKLFEESTPASEVNEVKNLYGKDVILYDGNKEI